MPNRRRRRRETLVVTGIASRLGRMLARALHSDYDIIGVDHRGARHVPKNVTVHAIDVRRRQAEDVFRRNRIDAVVHLGEPARQNRGERTTPSVEMAQRVLNLCQRNNVPKVVILSSALLYGPNPDNDQFLTEDEPLRAGQRFSSMREHVEIDLYASTFFWRYPEADTVLLRPVSIVGRLTNPQSQYLSLKRVPTVLGFDPMIQVISPEEVLQAIRLSLKPGVRGVFNIAGPGAAPLSAIIHRTGRRAVSIPEPLFHRAFAALSRVSSRSVPRAEIDYLKYICMVSDARAREQLGWAPKMDLDQTLEPLRI